MTPQPRCYAGSAHFSRTQTAMQGWWQLFCIFSLFSLALGSQAATPKGTDRLPTTTDSAEAITVPFEYHRHVLFVHGSLDGHAGLTFMVDTGASVSVLNTWAGFTGTHLRDTPVLDLNGKSTAELVQFETLRIPGTNDTVARQNAIFLRMDLSNLEQALGTHINGILGIPFFAESVTEFDYPAHLLRFYDEEQFGLSRCEPDNRLSYLLELDALYPAKATSCLVASGSVRGHSYRFLLDTGYTGSVSVAAPIAQEAGLCNPDNGGASSSMCGLASSGSSRTVSEAGVVLGNIDLRSKPASVRSPASGGLGDIGLVGNQFLEHYRMVLDYKRHKLWLEHPAD